MPQIPSASSQVPHQVTGRGSAAGSLVLNSTACGASTVSDTEAFREEGRKSKNVHAASPALEKRKQLLGAPSGA